MHTLLMKSNVSHPFIENLLLVTKKANTGEKLTGKLSEEKPKMKGVY